MKNIYLLFVLFLFGANVQAQNWEKYDVIINDMIIPDKYACNRLDSIDLVCAENKKEITFLVKKYTYLTSDQIDNILRYYPNLNSVTFWFENNVDTLIIYDMPERIQQVKIKNIRYRTPYISINGTGIDSLEIYTDTRYLNLYRLPDNLKYLFIANAYDMAANGEDELTINTTLPDQLLTFDCERLLIDSDIIFPLSLENFGVRLSTHNKDYVFDLLNSHKHLPKFDMLTFYSYADETSISLSPINHIKKLSLDIPHNYYLYDGIFTLDNFPEDLEYIKIGKILVLGVDFENTNVKTWHFDGAFYSNNLYYINEYLSYIPTIDSLIITNQENRQPDGINQLPSQIKYLKIEDAPNLICLPPFPETLQKFEAKNLGVSCIPNETFWVKETEEWPLCKNPESICNARNLYTISGSVYIDINNNNIIDDEDILADEAIVKSSLGYSSSFNNGRYLFAVHQPGEYPLELITPYDNTIQILPQQSIAVVNEQNKSVSIDFLISASSFYDLEITGTNTVARPGFMTQVHAFVKNKSTLPTQPKTIQIKIPSDWQVEYAFPSDYTIVNDTLKWTDQYLNRMSTNQYSAFLRPPATASILGQSYQYEISLEDERDSNKSDNYYSIIDTIVGSYDPNDKIVNHYTLSPELSNSKELIYTIRFQNTGTDTAFTVLVVDTIIGNLDPKSIRILGASHPYTWGYTGAGIATFRFENILLPDSNVNEPGSHGFITLALRPNKDLVIGDSIYNKAGIYFDFNEPVITDPALTRIATVTPIYSHTNTSLSIYPNPAHDKVKIEWNIQEPTILNITDLSGKLIQSQSFHKGQAEINVSTLSKGLYIIQLQSGQHLAVSKLMVQ